MLSGRPASCATAGRGPSVDAPLSRRTLLIAASLGLAGVGLAGCGDDGSDEATSWQRIADAARDQHPDLDVDAARRELGLDGSTDDLVAGAGPRVEDLRRRIAEDFAEGRTLLVSGWMLSLSEVHLALVLAEVEAR